MGINRHSTVDALTEPSSPSVRQFGSGFHSNSPSTYPSLGSPTRYGDQALVHQPFASPVTPPQLLHSANINNIVHEDWPHISWDGILLLFSAWD